MTNESGQSVDTLVRDIADRHAEHIALKDASGCYRYAELVEGGKRIAAYLKSRSVANEDIVLLLFNQAKEAVVAMLGVMARGAVYVPIEPGEPPSRLKQVVDDCKPSLVLTGAETADQVQAKFPGLSVAAFEDAVNTPASDGGSESTADDIAYIVYTSGSTGIPKGICQTHRNLAHFALTYTDSLGIGPADRVSMLYSLNFGASNMDIYGGLLRGASVCFFDIRNRGLSGFFDWLEAEKISVLHTVPSVFRHIVAHTPAGFDYGRIRAIDLAGEATLAADAELVRKHFPPDCVCLNHYALSEASVVAQHKMVRRKGFYKNLVPVGKPVTGMAVEIRNADGGSAAIGETGEIILKSRYISPGYHNRPEINERVFFADQHTGLRCLRTGDMGYTDGDGNLYHAGRDEFRVKINGVTVEIGEIESALNRIEGIRDAVVVAKEGANNTTELTAFLILEDAEPLAAGQIRKKLMQWLPVGLLPQRLIRVERFPTTTTGKVDRKRLSREPAAC